MKFTKFIPLACAVAFAFTTGASFAAETHTRSAVYDIEVPTLFNITEYVAPVTSPTAVTLAEDLSSLTWTGTMGATYQVATNNPAQVFYIHAVTGPSNTPAFNTDLENLKIVFSNTAVGQTPTTGAIEDARGSSPTAATNANCFAAPFTLGARTTVAGTDLPDPTATGNKLTYTAAGSGTWRIPFSVGNAAAANTFSPADAAGHYTATIMITDQSSYTP